MSIFQQAEQIYAEKNLDFKAHFIQYAAFAYAYADPQCIILAEVQGDKWFIEFAIGHGCLQRFIELCPFRLPYVSWKRGLRKEAKVKTFKFNTIERMIYGRRKHASTTETTGPAEFAIGSRLLGESDSEEAYGLPVDHSDQPYYVAER